jgi:hypothetical protein
MTKRQRANGFIFPEGPPTREQQEALDLFRNPADDALIEWLAEKIRFSGTHKAPEALQ